MEKTLWDLFLFYKKSGINGPGVDGFMVVNRNSV